MVKVIDNNNYWLVFQKDATKKSFLNTGLVLTAIFLEHFLFDDNWWSYLIVFSLLLILFVWNYKTEHNVEQKIQELTEVNNQLSDELFDNRKIITNIINGKLDFIFLELTKTNNFPKDNCRLRLYSITKENNFQLIGISGTNPLIVDNNKINNEYEQQKSTLLSFCLKQIDYNCFQSNLNINLKNRKEIVEHFQKIMKVNLGSYSKKTLKTIDFVSTQVLSQNTKKVKFILILESDVEIINFYQDINIIFNNNKNDLSIILDNIYNKLN